MSDTPELYLFGEEREPHEYLGNGEWHYDLPGGFEVRLRIHDAVVLLFRDSDEGVIAEGHGTSVGYAARNLEDNLTSLANLLKPLTNK